jgi:type IV secretory pathway VirB2 component (pilin)
VRGFFKTTFTDRKGNASMSAQHRLARVSAAALLALLGAVVAGEPAALKAAGFTGTMPAGGKVVEDLISTLQSNWEWLIATGVGLVLVIVAGLMMFGSQRAPDHLFRVIGGILLILVVIPAVLA